MMQSAASVVFPSMTLKIATVAPIAVATTTINGVTTYPLSVSMTTMSTTDNRAIPHASAHSTLEALFPLRSFFDGSTFERRP